jgi:hypothetical protein
MTDSPLTQNETGIAESCGGVREKLREDGRDFGNAGIGEGRYGDQGMSGQMAIWSAAKLTRIATCAVDCLR